MLAGIVGYANATQIVSFGWLTADLACVKASESSGPSVGSSLKAYWAKIKSSFLHRSAMFYTLFGVIVLIVILVIALPLICLCCYHNGEHSQVFHEEH
jgi:hypothetical protein